MSLPEDGVVEISIYEIPSILSAHPIELLSEEERHRADRFRFESDRCRFIASHIALRLKLAEYLDINPKEITFHYGPYGKPYIHSSTLRFNLSHSAAIVAMAFANSVEVGIDAESLLRKVSDRDALARRFFTSEEYASYLEATDHTLAFFRIWTRKEAFIKCTGEGLHRTLSSFIVNVDPQPRLLSVDGSASKARRFTMHEVIVQNHLVSSIAMSSQAKFRTNFRLQPFM